MALSIVQKNPTVITGVSGTLTLPSTTTAGSSIVVVIQAFTTTSTPSIHDDKSNVYTVLLPKFLNAADNSYLIAYITTPAIAGTKVITLGNTSGFINAEAYEIAGGGSPLTLHNSATTVINLNTALSVGPIAANAGECLICFGGESQTGFFYAAGAGWTLDLNVGGNGTSGFSESQIAATTTNYTGTATAGQNTQHVSVAVMGVQAATFTVSGNAGTCGATVSYTGPSSGSVVANSSGDFTLTGLVAGTYTVTPTKGGNTFSPTNQSVVVTSSNITGVNFFLKVAPASGAILTPVYVNSLTGANQNPLDPTNINNGGFGDMQVLGNVGVPVGANVITDAWYVGTPACGNDQYAAITVHSWTVGANNQLFLGVRSPDGNNGFDFNMSDNNDGTTVTAELNVVVGNLVVATLFHDGAFPVPVLCDQFVLVAVGTTLAVFKNTVEIVVVTDSHVFTGQPLFASVSTTLVTDVQVTNAVFGNAAGLLPPPTGGPHSPWISPLVRSSIEKGNA